MSSKTQHTNTRRNARVSALFCVSRQKLDYYNKATDPEVKKNFIITRSYVRIAQKVVDKKIPPEAFPVTKPAGFSVQYLLPDDSHVINEALGLALGKSLQKCLDTKAPGCR